MKKFILLTFLISSFAALALETKVVEYASKGVPLEGFVAYPDGEGKLRPGVVIVHDWMGPSSFTEGRAQELARLGYVAFAADIYGKGVRPKNATEAAEQAGKFKKDVALMRERALAARDQLASMAGVDPKKIAIMGYCFGGTVALELARSGAPLVGTVSFHGGLSTPSPQDARNIHGRVLVLHGADDPHVPAPDVRAFKDEMKRASVMMKFVAYKGAVHSFTNPAAGNDNSKGAAYNAKAAQKSWKELESFLKKVFKS